MRINLIFNLYHRKSLLLSYDRRNRLCGDDIFNGLEGIEEGDILVIDRALDPRDGDIVIAHVNGEFTVKYLDISKKDKGIVKLVPANPRYDTIVMRDGDELNI